MEIGARILLISAAVVLSAPALAEAPAFLVKDINSLSDPDANSGPAAFVTIGQVTYFSATDETHGRELWRTDGTAEGTVLVKDVIPGPGGSDPDSLVNAGGTLFFTARDERGGRELWKSDGTPDGTALVAAVQPQVQPDAPVEVLVPVGHRVLFVASSPGTGSELWRSDGTAAGTGIVTEINPGPFHSRITGLTTGGDQAIFFVEVSGRDQLWITNGTGAGTMSIARFGAQARRRIARVGDRWFFTIAEVGSSTELWTTDGTAEGTKLVSQFGEGSPTALTDVNGHAFFVVTDGHDLHDLWRSDGTPEETVRVTDLPSQPTGCFFASCPIGAVVDGMLFYVLRIEPDEEELWRTDGTPTGTQLVRRFASTSGRILLSQLTVGDGLLFFVVDLRADEDEPGPVELWITHGTGPQTERVFGFADALEQLTRAAGGRLLFAGNDGETGSELWATDGTSLGTIRVKDINARAADSSPIPLAARENTLLFAADDGEHGRELWTSDGTEAATKLVKELNPGSADAFPHCVFPCDYSGVEWNSGVYFAADDGTHGEELWRSDGTASGTRLVRDINPGAASSSVSNFTRAGNGFYFTAEDGVHGYELWRSDGTEGGTHLVKDLMPGATGVFRGRQDFVDFHGALFFLAAGALWRSDGTEEGTLPVREVNASGGLIATSDYLFFPGGDGLWKSDGTTAGTVLVSSIGGSNLTDANGLVFFTAGRNDVELYKSDGTGSGTVLVKEISQFFGSDPWSLTNLEGTLYFTANVSFPTDRATGRELWKSDGTAEGTILVKDINPGPGNAFTGQVATANPPPRHLATVGGRVVFAADDGVSGEELWASDGTVDGTILMQNIAAGAASSSPSRFMRAGSRLYFVADDHQTGAELWALPLEDVVPCPGDCNNDDHVAVHELVKGVRIALDMQPPADCPKLDTDANGRVSISELIGAVNAALGSCA